jgi:hypothetical protein
MRLAIQRVSGKVWNIRATKIVRGAARNAPGPPSSHAQKINPMKRTVGERLSPRPISNGERRFSASTLITITPAMTSNARSRPYSAKAKTTRRRHRKWEAEPGYEAQEEGKNSPHQRKVDPKHPQQDDHTRSGKEVDYGAKPELAHHAPAEDRHAGELRVIDAHAGVQPAHHRRPLREQEQHDDQDEEDFAQEVGDAVQDASDGPGEGAGFLRVL